jgi:hypothetical protein
MQHDRDLLAGGRPAPEVNGPFALQYHMTAEDPRQSGFAVSTAWVAGEQKGERENAQGGMDRHKYILPQRVLWMTEDEGTSGRFRSSDHDAAPGADLPLGGMRSCRPESDVWPATAEFRQFPSARDSLAMRPPVQQCAA